METRLPIPKNWQDFEQLCHALWKEIWGDPNAQRNGRSGQPQAGVDIFGRPMYLRRYSGVQCKDKDARLGSTLASSELLAECEKATSFFPDIADFTMATTAPRDEDIQREAKSLTVKRTFPLTSMFGLGKTSNKRLGLVRDFSMGITQGYRCPPMDHPGFALQ